MELVSVSPQLNLYDQAWPVLTHQIQSPPAKFVFDDKDRRGEAIQSMVSGGCVVSGSSVRNSLLFSRVHVHPHSTIEQSVVLPDVEIGEGSRISKAIIDAGCKIEPGTVIGEDADADRERGFRVTDDGITLVTPDMLGQSLHFTR
jgi:glucose-1-phosphate adenylyltransferase